MELATINLWCWIIPVIVGLICAYFGYLIGMARAAPGSSADELAELTGQNARLREELAECRELQSDAGNAKEAVLFDAKAARAAFGRRIKQDDLKLVEGIGPKIEGLFHNFDIKTWKSLSETSVAKCQEVLDSGGDRYIVHDPASWPMQAKMAYEGKWKELARWQEEHKHGKL